ncbi:MAG: LacI family transcriptional regulator [Acidobacteria bacterium]|nr:MAG: LacI family transcriptional regulator [Acidobacteriota bacterium]
MRKVHTRGRPIVANTLSGGMTGRHQTPANPRPVGIKDIAKALGLSNGTVDRALHSRGGINPSTKDRVLNMARKLGYKPNLAARYLKAPRQVRLAVNLPAKIASFFDAVRAGIIEASGPFQAGVDLCFRSHPTLGEEDEALFEEALVDGSKGIIIAPGRPAKLQPWIHKAKEKGIPVVCVATDAPGTDRLTCVSADPFISGGLVGELLSRMASGPGRVAVLTGDLSTFDHSEKVRGFKNSLDSTRSPLVLSAVLESHDDENAAYDQTRKLVLKEGQLKALYVSTANSIGVIRALEELDAECRLAVITTDLFPQIAPFVKSGRILATIHQRPEAQGRLSFEALYNFLVEGKCPAPRIKLNPHLVMRSNLDLFLERMSRAVSGNGLSGVQLL